MKVLEWQMFWVNPALCVPMEVSFFTKPVDRVRQAKLTSYSQTLNKYVMNYTKRATHECVRLEYKKFATRPALYLHVQ